MPASDANLLSEFRCGQMLTAVVDRRRAGGGRQASPYCNEVSQVIRRKLSN